MNYVLRKTKPQRYESIKDFCKSINQDYFTSEGHDACYSAIVRALNYNACKKILLEQLEHDGIDLETLKQKFIKDENLNNIYEFSCGGKTWTWDDIGDRMLRNFNATISFGLMSLSGKTCIAKACARMVVEEG